MLLCVWEMLQLFENNEAPSGILLVQLHHYPQLLADVSICVQ